ncbi:histidine phosphatase family protein [Hyphococcus flavus]|uniref:Histidine phosphatase family protein n=1 Tax=Hyphococcus flavus TaxID=1866326 RepID=A0AAF0CC93_9PROT|nr:histidine phosphatase family protein [Hyphococcus flavus]WDI32920.1 histidine phosphatase family protein [Hyphococcus flavus]
MLRTLCVGLAAAFLSGCATGAQKKPNEAAESVAFEALKRGGYVIVMRHANSPGDQAGAAGLSEGCRLAPGRGLDAKGFYQARSFGAILAENDVPILKAYTSRMCRSWDTAALTAGGAPVVPHDSQMSTDANTVAAFKRDVTRELSQNPGQNIILSSHSNIAPLYGATTKKGEKEVPSGVIYIVHPRDWAPIARMDLIARLPASPSVAVE